MPKIKSLMTRITSIIRRRNLALNTTQNLSKDYNSLDHRERQIFIQSLAEMHEIKPNASLSFAEMASLNSFKHVLDVQKAFTPTYRRFLINCSKSRQGIEFLMKLRESLLEKTANSQNKVSFPLELLSHELYGLLQLCFSPGLFKLQRITWESPTSLLERIALLESVHPIRSWLDLKSRLGPNRRVFVFTHPALGDFQPVVILHTALVDHIPISMASLIFQRTSLAKSNENLVEDRDKIKTAIFYSITSPQKGLRGIELGGVMIKNVVKEISKEFPKVKIFSTISPIPNFRTWLFEEIEKHADSLSSTAFQSFFNIHSGVTKERDFVMDFKLFLYENYSSPNHYQERCAVSDKVYFSFDDQKFEVKDMLRYFCTYYLTCVGDQKGKRLRNSVAHFHLSNGAQLWRLNWNADINTRGIENSFGMMVNYRYYLSETDRLNAQYLEHGTVSISSSVNDIYQNIPRKFRTLNCIHQDFDH